MNPVTETALEGGNVNGAVIRVRDAQTGSDTVRRAPGPQSATIQRLLAHVRGCGVTWVPEPLGFDDEGREVLGFIEGEVAHGEPDFRADAAVLTDVAAALRQWHDATQSFPRGDTDEWFPGGAGDGAAAAESDPVIAHNDFAPYNHVFRAGQFVGAIDFDVCYPASRAWDLAWTLYRYVLLPAFAPLAPAAAPGEPVEWPALSDAAATRVAEASAASAGVFMSSFGGADGSGPDTQEVLSAMPARLLWMAAWCARQDSAEHREWGRMYAAHAAWVGSVRSSGTV